MKKQPKISVVSGGFDPVHSGHIAYFNAAKKLGDKLIVALNSDKWLINKKGKFFMPFSERKIIIESFSVVDEVISFDDDKIGSATNALIKLKEMYPNFEIIFCNGGDRNSSNSPEQMVKGIRHEFEVGGSDKKNSSSWILENYYK
jgi:D-beta-D-heptose 7-phosphate kinase/D-beta-D-heptose 1-phosphate adenosyltransferase